MPSIPLGMLQTSNFLVVEVRDKAKPLDEGDDVGPLLEPLIPNLCLVAGGRVLLEMTTAEGRQPFQSRWTIVGSQFKIFTKKVSSNFQKKNSWIRTAYKMNSEQRTFLHVF